MLGKGKTTRIIVMFIVLFAICLVSNNVKAFSLKLTPLPERNAIQLDWKGEKNNYYKIWQLKPGDYQYHSISAIDVYNTKEKVQVLNIYPTNYDGEYGVKETVTFSTYDGERLTLAKSANLKQWMEEPNSEDSKGYGRGLIEVTPVKLSDFNKNPFAYLVKDSQGNYFYDVIYIGHWDANAMEFPNDNAVNAITKFMDSGRGVLCGHDVITRKTGINTSMGKIRKRFNVVLGNGAILDGNGWLGWDIPYNKVYGGEYIKIVKEGMLTDTPWEIGSIGTSLHVPLCHTVDQVAYGDIWMTFDESRVSMNDGDMPSNLKPYYNFYLTSWNNTAMIQTGHSRGNATSDEKKVIANTLFYLKQLTKSTFSIDNSARDIAAPNMVSKGYFTDSFVFTNPGDNGSVYRYYVENKTKGTKSNVISSTIATGVAGYAYTIDNNPNNTNVPTTVMTTKNSIYLVGIPNVNGKWIHIRTIDKAGNYSGVTHFQIKLGYADLSLRQFVSQIDKDGIKYSVNREPQVDTSPIKNGGTTANYNHTKWGEWVKRNDIITYTIRIYNEGTFQAYADEVNVYLPNGLEFIYSNVNKAYGWSISGTNQITSNYLMNKPINGYVYYNSYGNKCYRENISYIELKLECKVSENLGPYTVLTSLAEITKMHAVDQYGITITRRRRPRFGIR